MSARTNSIANDRAALRVWPLVFLGFLLLFLWFSWSHQQVGGLLFAVLCAGASSLYFVQAARWKRMHQRRERAASVGIQAGVPLASPQPAPHGDALPVPVTITLQPRWFRCVAWSALVGGAAFLCWADSWMVAPGQFYELQADWPYLLSLALLTAVLGCWRLFLPQRMVVSADGLLVQHPLYDWWASHWQAGDHLIPWHQVRLFAIRGGRPGTPATRYELASPKQVVSFGRARRQRWWALYRPVEPWEEYDAQMDALLALIAEKTGQPLYDVR